MSFCQVVGMTFLQLRNGRRVPLRIVFATVLKEPETFVVVVDYSKETFSSVNGPFTLEDGLLLSRHRDALAAFPYDDTWAYSELHKKLKEHHEKCIEKHEGRTLKYWVFQDEALKILLQSGIHNVEFAKKTVDKQRAVLVGLAHEAAVNYLNRKVDETILF